jgi:hypothetical protein
LAVLRAPHRRSLLTAALTLALVAAACSGDDGAEVRTESTSTSAEATTTTAATTTTGGCSIDGASPGTAAAPGTGGVALLTAVRTGRQPCADRVVFEFRGATAPGYTIEYQPGPFTAGESEQPLAVAGDAYLVVRLEPASGVDLTSPTAEPTYTGPAVLTPSGLSHVREVRRLSDFEAQLVWVIGLDGVHPFAVHTLDGPTRVYVDIAS